MRQVYSARSRGLATNMDVFYFVFYMDTKM